MIALDTPYPHSTQGRPQACNGNVGSGLIERVMCVADVFFNAPVRGQERRRSSQQQRVPLKVGRLEGSSIKLLLVLQRSLSRAPYESLMIRLLRLDLGLRRVSRVLLS